MSANPRPPTLHERESLMVGKNAKRTGFTPRPIQKLATKRKPHSILNVECNHFLRNSTETSAHGVPPLPYRMWLEAGKYEPPVPERPDPDFNSNVWRNFRKTYGFHTNTDGQKMNEMIASMYPMNIPPPSRVNSSNYSKFLSEMPLIQDQKLRRRAIDKSRQDAEEFRRMRLKSEMRNPPLDDTGNIVPPLNFKRHEHYFVEPTSDEMAGPAPHQGDTRVDVFGRHVPEMNYVPFYWKLTGKLNQPEADKLQEAKMQRLEMARQNPMLTTTRVT